MGVQAIKQGRAPAGSLHGESRQRWADATLQHLCGLRNLIKQAPPTVEHPRDVRTTEVRLET